MIKKKFVVDTDLLVDLLRKVKSARRFFKEIESGDYDVYFSTITEAELYAGKDCSSIGGRKIIEDLLALMKRVDVSRDIAKKAGELRRKHKIKLPDAIIAATAMSVASNVLATRNTKHYKLIRNLNILSPY